MCSGACSCVPTLPLVISFTLHESPSQKSKLVIAATLTVKTDFPPPPSSPCRLSSPTSSAVRAGAQTAPTGREPSCSPTIAKRTCDARSVCQLTHSISSRRANVAVKLSKDPHSPSLPIKRHKLHKEPVIFMIAFDPLVESAQTRKNCQQIAWSDLAQPERTNSRVANDALISWFCKSSSSESRPMSAQRRVRGRHVSAGKETN